MRSYRRLATVGASPQRDQPPARTAPLSPLPPPVLVLAARPRPATNREQRGAAFGTVALPTGPTVGQGYLSASAIVTFWPQTHRPWGPGFCDGEFESATPSSIFGGWSASSQRRRQSAQTVAVLSQSEQMTDMDRLGAHGPALLEQEAQARRQSRNQRQNQSQNMVVMRQRPQRHCRVAPDRSIIGEHALVGRRRFQTGDESRSVAWLVRCYSEG